MEWTKRNVNRKMKKKRNKSSIESIRINIDGNFVLSLFSCLQITTIDLLAV